MSRTVDALLPLSFLVAVRAVDRPVIDPETEFVDELRNKRLGMSDTVHAQIRRYADEARRRRRTAADEAVALARLIGRRPDAEQVFRAAGRYLAEQAYQRVPAATRRVVRSLPRLISRPIIVRQVRRAARRYFAGTVARAGAALVLEVPAPITALGGDLAAGCAYYETGFREFLRLLVGSEGVVEHVRCASRHEGKCQWRAEWAKP
jgi:hypothetical protein